jgi:transcriptional regulator with XRE-family HTH domain
MAKGEGSVLAARLRGTARAANLTSEDLAHRLEVKASTVRAWWSGRNQPPAGKLRAYAEAVGTRVSYLLTGGPDFEALSPEEEREQSRVGLKYVHQLRSDFDRQHMEEVDPHDLIERANAFLGTRCAAQVMSDWMLMTEDERNTIARLTSHLVKNRRGVWERKGNHS